MVERTVAGGFSLQGSGEANIRVAFQADVPRSAVEPLLDELREPFADLDIEERYAGGGGPIAPDLVISIVYIYVFGSYAKGFFTKAGEAHYDALHYQFSRLLNYLKSKYGHDTDGVDDGEDLPRFAPVVVEVGRAHFYFQEELCPEEIAKRLRKAQDCVDALPEQDLRPVTLKEEYEAGGPYNFFWDSATESWVEVKPRSNGYSY